MRCPLVLCAALSLALPACRGCDDPPPERPGDPAPAAPDPAALPDTPVTCPVCGLVFDAKEAAATRSFKGATYYFLLEDHARAFAANPEAYVAPDASP